MTGTSCGFLLTKSSDLPLYYFPFSLFVRLCFIEMDTMKHPVLWRIRSRRCLRTYCKLKQVLMVTSTFELCCRLSVTPQKLASAKPVESLAIYPFKLTCSKKGNHPYKTIRVNARDGE
jgi:hypothetical protein